MRGASFELWPLVLAKLVGYGWLFAFARLLLPKHERPSLWRPVIAAPVRLLLGFILGLPLVLLVLRFGPEVAITAMSILRLGLWMAVTALAFPKLPWTTNFLFSLGATALNTVLDFTIGHWATADYGLC